MKKLGLLLFLLMTATGSIQAQNIVKSLERTVPGQGTVTIHQESHIESQLGTERASTGEETVIKAAGFRIQVYAGNNSRDARSEANGVASRVRGHFPELKIYTSFTSPRWLCRVGDFRSIEEADFVMRKLKSSGVFREVSIVKEQINISL